MSGGGAWGAAAGVATSLGSSFISNAGNRKRAKEARNHDIKMWHMNNMYNHPTAQRERLKEAGLNPNLIYGTSPSSAVGSSSPLPPAKAAPYQFENPLKDISLYADFDLKEAQTDNVLEQSRVYTQDVALKAAQTAKTLSEGASAKVKAEIDSELKQTSMDIARQGLRNQELDSISKELDNQFKDESLKDRLKNIFYDAQLAEEKIKTQSQDTRLRSAQAKIQELDIQLRKLGIMPNDPMYARILGQLMQHLGGQGNPAVFPKEHKSVTSEAENQRKRAQQFKQKKW